VMTSASKSGLQRVAALGLLTGLLLVICAPLWHRGHPSSITAHDHANGSDIHLCETGMHASGPLDRCPICFTQRLLTHGCADLSKELSAPSGDSELDIVEAAGAAIAISHPSRARAPTLC